MVTGRALGPAALGAGITLNRCSSLASRTDQMTSTVVGVEARVHVLRPVVMLRTTPTSIRSNITSASSLTTFRQKLKLIYFSNLTQTLCYNYVAIVVLEVTLLRPV